MILAAAIVLAGLAAAAEAPASPPGGARDDCAERARSADARSAAEGRECLALKELQELIDGERWDEVLPSLERGLQSSSPVAADAARWTPVPAELFLHGMAEESLAAAKLLEKRWPREPEVLGAVGTALAVLERDDEALVYLAAAARYAPQDPVARWNHARLLAYMGRTEAAAAEFSAWSSLEKDGDRLVRNSCIYAGFVEEQLGDRARACMLQEEFCPEPKRSACAPLPPKEPQP